MPFLFFFFLLLLSYAPLHSSYTPPPFNLHRRFLHQPFFPLDSFPPSQPPSLSPPQPKFPFSTNAPPFFPFYPSPPPPPPTPSLVTFPANISSIIFPNSSSQKPKSPKIAIAVALPLLFAALLAALAIFFFYRRRRNIAKKSSRSDSHRLFPANAAPSDGPKADDSAGVPPSSSEFLYLGTLVNSRGPDGEGGSCPAAARSSPYQKLGSPELRPLPPLTQQFRQNYRNTAELGSEEEQEDEDFYSPRGSSGEKESYAGTGSSSRRVLPAAAEKYGSRSTNSSTLSYPYSNSTSPTLSSHSNSPFRSERTKAKSPDAGLNGITFAPPPPRPMTPSPPKRKPPSPSPPSSPPEEYLERNPISACPPVQIGGFSAYTFSNIPPPPPPPPPPAGFWDITIPPLPQSREPPSRPPLLVTSSRTVEMENPMLVSPAALTGNSYAVDRNEDTPKPKLKPLHWDKVRASSDRVMVWDQLKSSSFQLNEEMIETLFVCNTTNSTPKEMTRRLVLPSPNQENRVLDPKKSQNIAILLRALNVTKEEVCEALLEGNSGSLGTELLETLLKMAPTIEEELKLKEYKDESPFKLGPAEKFLKAVVDVPFAFKRVDAMLYIANFDSEVKYLRNSFETLEVNFIN